MRTADTLDKFWEEDDREPFSSHETRLYLLLMRRSKGVYLTISDSVLAMQLGTSLNTFKKARDRLFERGMLSYRPGGVGCGVRAEYKVKVESKARKKETDCDLSLGTEISVNERARDSRTKDGSGSKDESGTKDGSGSREDSGGETKGGFLPVAMPKVAIVSAGGLRKVGDEMLIEIKTRHAQWIEVFCMNNHISSQQFNIALNVFVTQLQNDGEKEKDVADFMKHFSRWYNNQGTIKSNQNQTNQTNNESNKPNKADRRKGTEVSADESTSYYDEF